METTVVEVHRDEGMGCQRGQRTERVLETLLGDAAPGSTSIGEDSSIACPSHSSEPGVVSVICVPPYPAIGVGCGATALVEKPPFGKPPFV